MSFHFGKRLPLVAGVIGILLSSLSLKAKEELQLRLQPNHAYPGEPIVATLSFQSDPSLPIDRIETPRFHAEDFLVEKLDENLSVKEGSYRVQSHWLLLPKTFGHLRIPPQSITLYRTDKKSFLSRAKKIFTHERILPVAPLPEGIDFVGDVKMHLLLDRNRSHAALPVTATLHFSGTGDLRRLKAPDLNLTGVLLYAGTPKIETKLLPNGSYGGSWSRSYTLLAEKDFTLPSLRFRYLNSSTDTVEILQSTARTVPIENPKLLAQRREKIGIFLLGILLGALASLLILLTLRRRRNRALHTQRAKNILCAKNDRELYTLLLPFAGDRKLSGWMELLEGNLYRGEKNKIEKKLLAKRIEEIDRKKE